MTGFTKLFSSMLDSTIWREDDKARILWITMLAMSDKDGVVKSTVPGLADRARIAVEECEIALGRFQQPDKYSRSQEHEGRRIIPVDGGWLLINHSKYRALMSAEDRREKARIRKENQRSRDKERDMSQGVTPGHASHDITEAEAEAEKKTKSSNPDGFDATVSELFAFYLERMGRNPKTYTLTQRRKQKAISRLRECLKKTAGNLDNAKQLMRLVIAGLAASDFHMGRDPKTNGKKYCEWEENLFKSYEQMERWWNRVPAQAAKPNGHGAEMRA